MRHGLPDELVCLVDEVQGLLEIDDVNPIALSENESLHLRVPAPGLVAKVNAALQQLPHGDDRCHTGVPFLLVRRVPVERRVRLVLAPVRTHRGCEGHGPKSAHRGEGPGGERTREFGRKVRNREACGLADRGVVYPVQHRPRCRARSSTGRLTVSTEPLTLPSTGRLAVSAGPLTLPSTGRLTRVGVPDGRRSGAVPP